MLKEFFLSGVYIGKNNREYRRLIMINVVFMLAMFIYVGFAIINYLKGDYPTATIDFVFAIPTIYGYFELRRKKDIKRASTYAILLLFTTMLIVLFALKAKEYTILWSLLFAFIAMMLKGTKTGFRFIVVFYAIVYVAAFNCIGENLLMTEYIRFIAVSLVVIAIAYFYEKSISEAFDMLESSNNELKDLNQNLQKNVQKGIEELRKKDELVIKTAKNAVMGEMIGAISHQWKQPLNSLGLLIQNIPDAQKYNELDDKYLEDFLDKSMKQIKYMSKTIDDFRNFLKPEKSKENFYICNAIEDVLGILEKQLAMATIEVKISPCQIEVFNYKGELEQVLLNLINNAKDALVEKKQKYPEFKPKIDIDIKNENGKNIMTVSDNADGIPQENLQKIFESHFTTKSADKGTGIGLYISKMIVEDSLKGSLTAHNGTQGGAVFTITF